MLLTPATILGPRGVLGTDARLTGDLVDVPVLDVPKLDVCDFSVEVFFLPIIKGDRRLFATYKKVIYKEQNEIRLIG